jgi:REP element-mobilizing transposase RayT
MPKPRKQQVSLDATPYYHCTSRCVRRAFLCGFDPYSGQSYEHRRQWVEDRIHLLASVFAIDVCAYAVMSNHLHVVLHINSAEAKALTAFEVCERWHQIYNGTLLTQRYIAGDTLSKAEIEAVDLKIELWRKQLADISWFMRALNEPIARQANAEDRCTGKFWESRFSSQALLDDKALAACMAYVDLNPIRAKMAKTPEISEHTSVKTRLEAAVAGKPQPKSLFPFVGNERESMPKGLPFKLADYFDLVEWSGRIIREDKRGAISGKIPPLLERLQIDPDNWKTLTTQFERSFKSFVGEPKSLASTTLAMRYQRSPGLSACRSLLQ